MDQHSTVSQEKKRPASWLKSKIQEKIWSPIINFVETAKKVGKDDPRRIVHATKVAMAITLVSLFYYFDPLFEGFGVAAMWAVLTTVVVFEFTVGGTLGKGLNRIAATLFGGLLGLGAYHIANKPGQKYEPIFLGLFVFMMAIVMTFLRFFPKMKPRYDYALSISILTFALVCVSGYREQEVIEMAFLRISTIIIGGSVAMATSILICPVWAGRELHNLAANNLEKLGNFLLEFGPVYFNEPRLDISKEKKSLMDGFKSILNTKSNEDTLTNNARWEPGHDRFRYRHPWYKYQKIGDLARDCATILASLNRYLRTEKQAPVEITAQIEAVCMTISVESGKALKELSQAIKTMTQPPATVRSHIESSRSASKSLTSLFKITTRLLWTVEESDDTTDLSVMVSAAAVASLLLEAATAAELIADAVEELATLAGFKSVDDGAAAEGDGGPPQQRPWSSRRVGSEFDNATPFERVQSIPDHHTLVVEEEVPCSPRSRHRPAAVADKENPPPSLSMT